MNSLKILEKMNKIVHSYIYFLNDIESHYEELIEINLQLSDNNQPIVDMLHEFNSIMNNEGEIRNKLITFKQFQNKIENEIYKTCPHEFVEDWIDVDPDVSMKIVYCKHCECNYKN
jgi:hypothetical protein